MKTLQRIVDIFVATALLCIGFFAPWPTRMIYIGLSTLLSGRVAYGPSE